MPQFEVSIPYTGIQTRIVLADSPEEALEKAKNGDLFLLGGGDCAVDDHSEDIRLSWCRAKAVPLECEVPSYSGLNQYFRNPAKGKGRKCGQGNTQ